METDLYILPKQLWSSPTLLTRMASLMKEEFMLKYEIQKGTRLHSKISIIGTSHMYGYVLNLPYVVQ